MFRNYQILLIIFLIVFLALNSCKEGSNPNNSTPVNGAHFFLDFQGGFENVNLEIYFDDILRYDKVISSNPTTDFAERVKIYTTPEKHHLLINLNKGDFLLDTTIFVSDSLIWSIINDTLYNQLFIQDPESLPDYPVLELNDFQHLEISYLNGVCYSNLMPPNLIDPLSFVCSFKFLSKYDKKIISGIYPEEIFVQKLPEDIFIGNITMYPWPEIYLYPGIADTITFYYIRQPESPFEVPCNDSLYLKMNLRDQNYRGLQIRTNHLLYKCDY